MGRLIEVIAHIFRPKEQVERVRVLKEQDGRVRDVGDRVDRILEIQAELIRRES